MDAVDVLKAEAKEAHARVDGLLSIIWVLVGQMASLETGIAGEPVPVETVLSYVAAEVGMEKGQLDAMLGRDDRGGQ